MNKISLSLQINHFFKKMILITCFLAPVLLVAQNEQTNKDNLELLEQYVLSKGNYAITFDAANIKQFWVDKSVVSLKDHFSLLMNKASRNSLESPLFPVQIKHVRETMDCKIEIVTECDDMHFSVLNSSKKEIAKSESGEKFLHYNTYSTTFHWEEIKDIFYLKFNTAQTSELSIQTIIFTFPKNTESTFLESPGILRINADNVSGGTEKQSISDKSFSVSGKRTVLLSKNKILVTDNTFSSSVTVKNTTEKPVDIYVGYAPYTKENQKIQNNANPYNSKKNEILKVVSFEQNTNKIIVDSYPEWKKNCFLALNAKEDYSDFPNFSIIGTPISEVNKIDDSHTEIVFSKPITQEIPQGTPVRVHSPYGSTYIFTTRAAKLQPGEEQTFQSSIRKDDSLLLFSSKAFSKGVYYVVPVFLSYSVDQNDENTVVVSDFTISY